MSHTHHGMDEVGVLPEINNKYIKCKMEQISDYKIPLNK
jgi:hypothetical protein